MSQETDSLVKRLAGPSTGKAGLVKDQTEINKIIAEASKGSKYYQNEKRKDKELTKRIEKLLQQRDDLLKGANINKLETHVDRLIFNLEAKRDLTQSIVHVDMDAFFANVELLDNPGLKGKAFGVGGLLTTASYEARQFGVRSGMPAFIAKKLCPHLILVPIRPQRYSEMSKKVMSVFQEYDPNMQAAGADEAYLNITDYCDKHDLLPEECVQQMRQEVFTKTGLTVSAGIAPNKMLAKICSDKNKPNGQYCMPFNSQSIVSFMRDLPIRKIPGVGQVTERLLASIDVKVCGDIYTQRATIAIMDKQFGMEYLLNAYLGLGSTTVEPAERESRKSVGAETTFASIGDKDKILEKLSGVASNLEEDLERTGWAGKTVTLKYKLDTYKSFTRAKSCDRYVNTQAELFAIGKELLLPELPLTLRLIGLRVTNLKDMRLGEGHGIKRYFAPAEGSPLRKKPKTSHTEDVEDDPGLGFVYSDHELHSDPDTAVFERSQTTSPQRSQKQTDPLRFQSHPLPEPSVQPNFIAPQPAYPTLSFFGSTPKHTSGKEKQQCPICSKVFEIDNAGLNEHIDFCLSKGLIMEASASASETSSKHDRVRSIKRAKGKHKPAQ